MQSTILGIGYLSLAYLKIDRFFVQAIGQDIYDEAMKRYAITGHLHPL